MSKRQRFLFGRAQADTAHDLGHPPGGNGNGNGKGRGRKAAAALAAVLAAGPTVPPTGAGSRPPISRAAPAPQILPTASARLNVGRLNNLRLNYAPGYAPPVVGEKNTGQNGLQTRLGGNGLGTLAASVHLGGMWP